MMTNLSCEVAHVHPCRRSIDRRTRYALTDVGIEFKLSDREFPASPAFIRFLG